MSGRPVCVVLEASPGEILPASQESLTRVVRRASTAGEAIELAQAGSVDLALVDAALPGAERAVGAIAGSRTAVLAIADETETASIIGMLGAGAIGWVPRACEPDDLRDRIDRALNGEGVLPASVAAALAGEVAELERAKKLVIDLLAHELLTPATVVQAVTLTLAKRRRELSQEQADELAERARKAGEHLRRIVASLSLAAELETGARGVDPQPIEAEAVLVAAADHFGRERRIRLPEPRPRCTLLADPALVAHALIAVLENALTFSPDDAEVELDAALIGAHVELYVVDRGPGIEAATRRMIFGAFEQASRGDTRAQQGLGLGLYLVLRIVEAHGGTIGLQDTPGGGTTFVLRFPRSRVNPRRVTDRGPACSRGL